MADLTRVVKAMADELAAIRDRADAEQGRADTQQHRIEIAALELNEVSARLQTAADALRKQQG